MSWAGLYKLRPRSETEEGLTVELGFKKNVNRATTQVMMKTGMADSSLDWVRESF